MRPSSAQPAARRCAALRCRPHSQRMFPEIRPIEIPASVSVPLRAALSCARTPQIPLPTESAPGCGSVSKPSITTACRTVVTGCRRPTAADPTSDSSTWTSAPDRRLISSHHFLDPRLAVARVRFQQPHRQWPKQRGQTLELLQKQARASARSQFSRSWLVQQSATSIPSSLPPRRRTKSVLIPAAPADLFLGASVPLCLRPVPATLGRQQFPHALHQLLDVEGLLHEIIRPGLHQLVDLFLG